MEKQMIVRIDEETKDKFFKIVRMEGKSASKKIREMVESYVSKNDFSAVVDDLWSKISKKIEERGYKKKDIDTAIEEVRKMK